MNFNLPPLPWQVSHSPGVAAVIRHSTFETGRTARRVLDPHPKNNAVYCLPPQPPGLVVPDDGSELLTRSIRWLTPSTYRTCQVFPLQPAPKVRKIRFECSATRAKLDFHPCPEHTSPGDVESELHRIDSSCDSLPRALLFDAQGR